MKKKLISIISPVYNEEPDTLQSFTKKIINSFSKLNFNYEIIFINDGSQQSTEECLNSITENHKHTTTIHLSRNFGHQLALSAGLKHSTGDAVIMMDSDLQDEPSAIINFIELWEKGNDVVYSIRTKRKESFFKRFLYRNFYKALKILSDINIPEESGDFCLLDRKVVDILVKMPERTRFIRGLRSWIGFKQVGIEVERNERDAGKSKFTIKRLFKLAFDGIFTFSFIPLRLISALGFIISILSILLAVFYTIKRVTIGLNPPGFATIIVMLSFFSGVQLFTIGILGEYLGRVFEEVKSRPLYLVKEIRKNESTNA